MNDSIEENIDPEVDLTPREPLLTFLHPEHGELTIYGFDGRSKLCRSSDGREFRIGTRVVNRLMDVPSRGPASERTLEIPFNAEVLAAEKIPEMVTVMLNRMPDDPVRVRIAREIWAAADAFLRT